MAQLMRAAVVEPRGQPLVLKEVGVPRPEPGQIRVGLPPGEFPQPLSAINSMMTRLAHGEVAARVVLDDSAV
jgi:D-arabinose 1-dehydrogenase-like Zn-dependent alcohol dehydrogenase